MTDRLYEMGKYWQPISILILLLANIFIWYVIYDEWPKNYFVIALLNVGQGESVYIESPTHNRMLVDGGSSNAVLSELRKVMPFYSRSIDTLVSTDPDSNYAAGLINVLGSYKINRIIESGVVGISETYSQFEADVRQLHLPKIIAARGLTIHLGGNLALTILYPDRDVSLYAGDDGSIVAKLTYGNPFASTTSVLMAGAASPPVEDYILAENNGGGDDSDRHILASTLLVAAHYDSPQTASTLFDQAVSPEWALVSAAGQGQDQLGRSKKSATDPLDTLPVKILSTFPNGTLIFHCTIAACTRVDS